MVQFIRYLILFGSKVRCYFFTFNLAQVFIVVLEIVFSSFNFTKSCKYRSPCSDRMYICTLRNCNYFIQIVQILFKTTVK